MCLVVFTGLYVDLHILNIHTCKHLHMFRFAYIAVMDFTMQVYVCQTWILFILYIVVHIHKLFYVRVHVYYSKNYNKFDTLYMCMCLLPLTGPAHIIAYWRWRRCFLVGQ